MIHPRLSSKTLATRRGFTVVELLVIIVVIGILATVSMVYYNGFRQRAINTDRLSVLTSYRDAFVSYAGQENSYPPVPLTNMYYCLGTNLASSAYITSHGGGNPPATILGQPAQYCGDILNSAERYAGYPALNNSLATVIDINEKDAVNNLSTYTTNIIGPGVQYIDAGFGTARLKIIDIFHGSSCPEGTVLVEAPDSKTVICSLDINKPYPVTYTSESWTYPS
jgi:type II secretory pathway pseudopilin PulG